MLTRRFVDVLRGMFSEVDVSTTRVLLVSLEVRKRPGHVHLPALALIGIADGHRRCSTLLRPRWPLGRGLLEPGGSERTFE